VKEDVLGISLVEADEDAACHPAVRCQERAHRLVRLVRRDEDSTGLSVRQRSLHQRSPDTLATMRRRNEEQLHEVTAIEVSLPTGEEPRDVSSAYGDETGAGTNQQLDLSGPNELCGSILTMPGTSSRRASLTSVISSVDLVLALRVASVSLSERVGFEPLEPRYSATSEARERMWGAKTNVLPEIVDYSGRRTHFWHRHALRLGSPGERNAPSQVEIGDR
jgi:hypothetical protein